MAEKSGWSYPQGLEIIHMEACASTNSYIKEHFNRLRDCLPVLVTTDLQTGGRGRDRRTWVSPRGKGLYSSFGFKMDNPGNLPFLPLAAGLSVIEIVKKKVGISAGLKWPNDIIYEGKKLAGILIENVIFDSSVFCVVGMGLNLNHGTEDFPGELTGKATSLHLAAGGNYRAEDFNPGLASLLFDWIDRLGGTESERTADDIVRLANGHSAFLKGREIRFHHGGEIVTGIFKGINRDGGLILKSGAQGETIHYAGEIESC